MAMRLLLPLMALALLLLYDHAALAADVCPNTGLASPAAPTLVVSPQHPASGVWLLGPDCDFETFEVFKYQMTIDGGGIERVESLPEGLGILDLTNNPLSLGADFSNITGSLTLRNFSPKLLDNVVFASSMASSLFLIDSAFTSLSNVALPDQVVSLNVTNTQLRTLKNVKLPSMATQLIVHSSKLSAIDLTFPPLLNELEISSALITKIENVVFPDLLQKLDFTDNRISVVKGVTWPTTLDELGFEGNALVEFEIRESDVAVFGRLSTFTGEFSKVECTDPTATLQEVKMKHVCVISDERFESLYRSITISPTTSEKPSTTKRPTTNSTVSTHRDDASLSDEEEISTSDNSSGFHEEIIGSRATGAISSNPGSSAMNDGGLSQSSPSRADSTGSGSDSTAAIVVQTKGSSNGALVFIFAGLSALVALLLVIGIYRLCYVSKKKRSADENDNYHKYHRVGTPRASTADATDSTAPSQEYLVNDVRNDKAMQQFRIGLKDVQLVQELARGGYGVIYRGVYQDNDVAVKQMLPGTWQDERALAGFMDEIRLCANLNHPKIVQFVGIAYSSLRDLSVVIEFMPGGDLHDLLHGEHNQPPSRNDWLSPWSSSRVKSKASIGEDIAEAVSYLHSLDPAVLHRDLKARNVLIDLDGNAKLSDFGISRELTIDETMTSGVGTAAWIAPEVLRGARYTEKADIYSLGVLFVELDRCQHPYADDPIFQRGTIALENGATDSSKPNTISHAAQKNTQIAVLVSTGKLRPSVSRECPHEVASLVAHCLSFDPADRPTAADVAKALGQFVRAQSA